MELELKKTGECIQKIIFKTFIHPKALQLRKIGRVESGTRPQRPRVGCSSTEQLAAAARLIGGERGGERAVR